MEEDIRNGKIVTTKTILENVNQIILEELQMMIMKALLNALNSKSNFFKK